MKRAIVIPVAMMFLSLNAYAQGDMENPEGNQGYSPAATAMPTQQQPSTTTLGFLLGPSFAAVAAKGTFFKLGPEISTKYFQMPLLFGFGDGLDMLLEIIPKLKYDVEVIPNLLITPSAGLDIWFGFAGSSFMYVGIELAARATYFVTPQIGIFFEPLALDMNFIHVDFEGDGSGSGLMMWYRLAVGAVYAF